MSTVYAFTTPARGHLYPIAPILCALRHRGHRVRVWTLSSELDAMRELGLEAEAVDPAIEALPVNDWEAGSPSQATVNTFSRFLARAPHEVEDVRRAVATERPDLILTDINAWGAPAAAEASGIPWATFAPFFSWYPARGVPVFGPGLRPMAGPVGRLRDSAMWRLVTFDLNRRFRDGLNEVRRSAGAAPLASMVELWARPPLILYMTVRELDYPRRDWPESFRFVGPINWEPRAEPLPWLQEVDRPLVLLTASTEYQADEELISTALEGLAGENLFVVATTAGCDPEEFDAPANARIERFVPHGPLLERAEAVVCHGGMGITQKALSAGVPVCVVGWGRDQLECGRRVEVAEAGALLPRRRLSAERLRDSLATTRTRRAGAGRVAAAIERAPGPEGAADELEALLPVAA